MDVAKKIKEVSASAKEHDFDRAIAVMQNLISVMRKEVGYSHANFCKIIPYYQKAGRYSEVETFCKTVLLPAVEESCQNTFGHQPRTTQQAFENLYKAEIYNKLRLCAQREKIEEDKSRFMLLHKSYYEAYESWHSSQYPDLKT